MSFLTPIISFLFPGPGRSFQNISGYITVTESTTDVLEITQQPVQQGASITDHAYLKPTQFTTQIQFAHTGLLTGLASSALGVVTGVSPTITGGLAPTYQALLDLQKSRVPFTIVTPKRVYKNMLMQSLGVTTDRKTENVLAVAATFQQVIIVSVSTVQVPRSQLKNAAKNGATQNSGHKSALLTAATALVAGQVGFTR